MHSPQYFNAVKDSEFSLARQYHDLDSHVVSCCAKCEVGTREAQLFLLLFPAQRIPARVKYYYNTFASSGSGSSGVFNKFNHK